MNIVCIGDSIVEGEGDELGLSGWAGRLQQKILKGAKVGEHRVYNLGMGMETSLDLMHRFFSEVLYRDPDVIIMQASHGDSRSMLNNAEEEEFEIGKGARMRSYHKLFTYLAQSGKKVLILGLNPVSMNAKFKKAVPQRAQHIESHNRGLEKLCEEYELPFLDLREDVREYEEKFLDSNYLSSGGHKTIAKALAAKINLFLPASQP